MANPAPNKGRVLAGAQRMSKAMSKPMYSHYNVNHPPAPQQHAQVHGDGGGQYQTNANDKPMITQFDPAAEYPQSQAAPLSQGYTWPIHAFLAPQLPITPMPPVSMAPLHPPSRADRDPVAYPVHYGWSNNMTVIDMDLQTVDGVGALVGDVKVPDSLTQPLRPLNTNLDNVQMDSWLPESSLFALLPVNDDHDAGTVNEGMGIQDAQSINDHLEPSAQGFQSLSTLGIMPPFPPTVCLQSSMNPCASAYAAY